MHAFGDANELKTSETQAFKIVIPDTLVNYLFLKNL
jgi:hypothetical protein